VTETQQKISETKSDSTVPGVLSRNTVLLRGNNPEFSKHVWQYCRRQVQARMVECCWKCGEVKAKNHTESQKVRGWKGTLWVTQSNPLPKQDHPEQAAQDCVQAGLEYLQRRRIHDLSGQLVPGPHHPQREEVLPHVQLELPLLQFVPIAPCPVAGHH